VVRLAFIEYRACYRVDGAVSNDHIRRAKAHERDELCRFHGVSLCIIDELIHRCEDALPFCVGVRCSRAPHVWTLLEKRFERSDGISVERVIEIRMHAAEMACDFITVAVMGNTLAHRHWKSPSWHGVSEMVVDAVTGALPGSYAVQLAVYIPALG
jgi:hypothetical protein